MTKVNTLFGSYDEDDLKKLKGYVDEVVLHMHRNDGNNQAIKDIVDIDIDIFVLIVSKMFLYF